MSSNQRGPTLVAPEYGVTRGGLPMYARRAMTVGLATLVAAGVVGPATAQAAEASSWIFHGGEVLPSQTTDM